MSDYTDANLLLNSSGLQITNIATSNNHTLYYCHQGMLVMVSDTQSDIIYAPTDINIDNVYYYNGWLYGWDFSNQRIWGYEPSSGKEIVFPDDTLNDLPYRFFCIDGKIFIEYWYSGVICSYDIENHRKQTYEVPRGMIGYRDETLYVCTKDNRFLCIDTTTNHISEVNINLTPEVTIYGFYFFSDSSIVFATDQGIWKYQNGINEKVSDYKDENIIFEHDDLLYFIDNNQLSSLDITTGNLCVEMDIIGEMGSLFLAGDNLCGYLEDTTISLIKNLSCE